MKLTLEQRETLFRLFEVPKNLQIEALKMLSQQEQLLILLMEKAVFPSEELSEKLIEAKLTEMPQVLIDNAYRRYVISKVRGDDGTLCYQIADFYCRFPYYAQFEAEEYTKFTDAQKKKLNDWDLDVYIQRNREMIEQKKQGDFETTALSEFLTLEEAEARVDREDMIYRVPCNCKCMMDVTPKPRNVCLCLDGGENSLWDRGHGERLTPERAKELIRQWNAQGLMQNGEHSAICNCDGASCYPIQVSQTLGAQGLYPRAKYDVLWDEAACIHCGKCAKVCNFNAFSVDENRKIHFDVALCWSCTICANHCPKAAISLRAKV